MSTENSALEKNQHPLVSVLIVARNRPAELADTLQLLQRQMYPRIEVIVIDDNSEVSLDRCTENISLNIRWIKNSSRLGYIASRSNGFAAAQGEYILLLDDDSCLTEANDLECAINRVNSDKAIAVLAFAVHNGLHLNASCKDRDMTERYVNTYTGCGALISKKALEQTGPYRDFFQYYAEEVEHSARLINQGWLILYFPSVLVHHRKSSLDRSEGRIWAYSARNEIWTTLIICPLPNLLFWLPWKIAVHTLECLRRFEICWAAWAIWSFIAGLPEVLNVRNPVTRQTIKKLRAAQVRRILSGPDFEHPQAPTLAENWSWLTKTWWRRRRVRAFWDRRSGNLGSSQVQTYSQRG